MHNLYWFKQHKHSRVNGHVQQLKPHANCTLLDAGAATFRNTTLQGDSVRMELQLAPSGLDVASLHGLE